MDTRLAKHLLVNSSLPVDIGDNSREGGWTVNAAGCGFKPELWVWPAAKPTSWSELAREGLTISPPTREWEQFAWRQRSISSTTHLRAERTLESC